MVENRGGLRPTAKQNNPANISGTGGNGQSGRNTQPARYISGLPYGDGQKTMDQQTSAPMAGKPIEQQMPAMPPMTALMSESSRPDEPVTTGINSGPGAGSEVMQSRPNTTVTLAETMRNLIQFDPSGDAELIYRALRDQGY